MIVMLVRAACVGRILKKLRSAITEGLYTQRDPSTDTFADPEPKRRKEGRKGESDPNSHV